MESKPLVLQPRNQQAGNFYQQPAGTGDAPASGGQDLYPTLSSYSLSPKTAGLMRQQGMNPTALQQQFEQAHATGDFDTKARLANQFAALDDHVGGGNAATNFLNSHRLRTQEESTPTYGSVGKAQAFYGSIKNGLVDVVEAVPQLLTAGAGLTHAIDNDQWSKAHKGIEDYFAGWKTYISEDYQKPLVSYDSETGIQTNLDMKSLIGTTGNLISYILPALLTEGVSAIATGAERAALSGVGKYAATTLAERAAAGATLDKVGRGIKYAVGTEAFLQTFPMYQREGLANGLDIHDATVWALPVAAINAVIETANVGALNKAFGISSNAGRAAIREVGLDEATKALLKLPQGFTGEMLADAGQQAAKNALGVIARPQELGAFGRLVSNIGGRVKRGFFEQGTTEGGEEVLQSLVENSSKQIYNNIQDSDASGRFKDPTFGNYVFDALYGGALGAVVGTTLGSLVHTKQADPTVFSYVAANVRDGLRKGYTLDDMLSGDAQNPARLKMLGLLDHKVQQTEEQGGIDPDTHADMVSKVTRMAGVANDFADVNAFTEGDRQNMFAISEAKYKAGQTAQSIDQSVQQVAQLDQAIADPNTSTSDQIKAQIARGKLTQVLGNQITQPDGSTAFEAQVRSNQHQTQIENVVSQAMTQYANDTARPAINAFVRDNLQAADRQFGQTTFPDDFKPAKIVTDHTTGQSYVSDKNKLVFRDVARTGGTITQPATIDENGQYVPSVREAVTETYAQPVSQIDKHLSLVNALADPANPLEAQDYRKPDNSVEAGLLADGSDIVQNIQQLTQGKRKKDLAAAKTLGLAYLNGTQTLASDPKYAPQYQTVVDALSPLVADAQPTQDEQNAVPVGDDVDLLAEGDTLPDETGTFDPDQPAPLSPEETIAAINRVKAQQTQLYPDTNAQTERSPTPISNQSLQPAGVGQSVEQPQTPESELALGLQRADSEEQRAAAGGELSSDARNLRELAATPVGDSERAITELLAGLDREDSAQRAELGANESPATPQSADQRALATEPTAEGLQPGATQQPDGRVSPTRQTLSEVWDTLTPEQQQQAGDLASQYQEASRGDTLVEASRKIVDNPPRIKGLEQSFVRMAGRAFWMPVMQAKYGARADDSTALTLDQYAAQLSESGTPVTEQDVVDFLSEYPYGPQTAITEARKAVRQAFKELTGKDINALSAQNVQDWLADQPGAFPEGVDDFDQSTIDAGTELEQQLTPEEAQYVGDLAALYEQNHGDQWLLALNADARAGKLLIDLPESIERLVSDTAEKTIFDDNQQNLHDVQRYLRNTYPRSASQSIPDYQPGQSGADGIDTGEETATSTAESQPADRPDIETLARAADFIESDPDNYADRETLSGIAAEVDSQIENQAASDPRTAAVTAPFDIDRADSIKREQAAGKRIETRNADLAKRTTTGDLFPTTPSKVKGKKAQVDAFASETTGVDAENAVKAANAVDQQIIDTERQKQDDIENRKIQAIERAVTAPVQQTSIPLETPAETPANPQAQKNVGDLIGQVQRAMVVPDFVPVENVSNTYFSPTETGVDNYYRKDDNGNYVRFNTTQDSEFRRQVAEYQKKSQEQSAQKTALLAYLQNPDSAFVQAVNENPQAVEQAVRDAQDGKISVPYNVLSGVKSLLSDGRNASRLLSATPAQLDAMAGQVETPKFSLNESQSQTPIGALGEKLRGLGFNIITDQAAYNQALADSGATRLTGGRAPIAFRWQGAIYLSPDSDMGSLLHEATHVWAGMAQVKFPELYKRGVQLISDTGYKKSLANDPYYSTLSPAEQDEEALAHAIGDRGGRFLTESRRSGFRSWLNSLWSKVKSIFGLDAAADLNTMTLDDFIKQVVGQIESGDVQNQSDNATPQFQLPGGIQAQVTPVADLKAQAIRDLTQTPSLVQNNLMSKRKIDLTSVDRAHIAEVAKQTGFLLKNGKLEWQHPAGFFHGTNGSAVQVDLADVAAVMQDNFGRGFNAEGNKGWVFRQMFDKLRANINLESFIKMLDDSAGSLRALILDPQREDGLRADYVHNTLKGYRERAEKLLTPFSTLLGNSNETVKTLTVQSYDYDENGNVVLVDRQIPIATAMSMVLSNLTQFTSHGKAAGVVDSEPRADTLYARETNGRLTRNNYGEMYQDRQTGEVHHLLVPRAEADALVRRFREGMGAYDGEQEAFAALHDYFNEGSVADLLETVANELNPDTPFQRVVTQAGADNYYPVTSAQSESDARLESRDRKKTLDENKRILARTGAPKATILQDPVSVMRGFENAATDVIAYGRTVDNMTQVVNSLDKYQGPKQSEIRDYLQGRIVQIQNYRQTLAKQQASAGGATVVLDKIMKMYSRSVLNSVGSGAKQAITYGSALSSKVIDPKYLKSSEALGVLRSLTVGGYAGVAVRGDIDITGQTNQGLTGITGDTAEKQYIEKLLGNDIQDPDAKRKHQQRWATVINRTLGSANQFVDGAQFEDFGLDGKTLTNVQKKLRQADLLADRWFTTINQRVDRGVVFSWAKASELSGIDKGLTGDALDEYTAKTTTSLLYENYSLQNLFTRTNLSLSDNFLYKMLGLYASQAQTQGNLLLRSIADWSKAEPGSEEASRALKQLYSTAGWAIMFNAVGVATISGLSRALIAVLSGGEPDDADKIANQIAFDTVRNIVGVYPGLAQAGSDYLISTNDTINSGGNDNLIDFPAAELIQQGLDSVSDAGTILFTDDEKKADTSLNSLIRDLPDMAAKGLGIPGNLRKIVVENLKSDE